VAVAQALAGALEVIKVNGRRRISIASASGFRDHASMTYEIRRIRPGEGGRLREIRLRALADAPTAFSSLLADESNRPQAVWDDAAATRSAGDGAATFVAEVNGNWVGLAGGYRPGDGPDVELVSMWVAPEARRLGVGRMLVGEVVAWARTIGAPSVGLWVTRGNDAAATLYGGAGFSLTHEHQPVPSGPCREEERMVLVLDQAVDAR
jgi:GNAT superfamily N-acetyltransferase